MIGLCAAICYDMLKCHKRVFIVSVYKKNLNLIAETLFHNLLCLVCWHVVSVLFILRCINLNILGYTNESLQRKSR